jgi:hypothetical protein
VKTGVLTSSSISQLSEHSALSLHSSTFASHGTSFCPPGLLGPRFFRITRGLGTTYHSWTDGRWWRYILLLELNRSAPKTLTSRIPSRPTYDLPFQPERFVRVQSRYCASWISFAKCRTSNFSLSRNSSTPTPKPHSSSCHEYRYSSLLLRAGPSPPPIPSYLTQDGEGTIS